MHRNFKVVKIISFGVHRPCPNAWQVGLPERLADRHDMWYDGIDMVNALHSGVKSRWVFVF